MRKTLLKTLAALWLGSAALAAFATAPRGFDVSILVDGAERPEYHKGGTVYIEAQRDRDYSIRLTNPLPYRVAVALSVDGLNSIDAKHTDPWSASKWVLDPYESVVIAGWQVSGSTARRFTFTGERQSYGALLGQTENLGVIEAVFYRETPPKPRPYLRKDWYGEGGARGGEGRDAMGSAAPAPRSDAREKAAAEPLREAQDSALSDEYAATGMGDPTRHDVTQVHLELVRAPMSSVRIRYEFRPQLVKLGILPSEPITMMRPPRRERPPYPRRPEPLPPLERREAASGFEPGYCPEPR